MKRIPLLAAAILALGLSLSLGCSTAPKAIPEGLSSSELIQRAQEASDAYNYDLAVQYYRTAMERYGTDASMQAMGQYEIAFIYYKQDKLQESEDLFKSLLALYDGPSGPSLPPRYRSLALKVLPKVEAALAAKATKAAPKK